MNELDKIVWSQDRNVTLIAENAMIIVSWLLDELLP
jgi:hypothetical protein